MPPNGRVQPRVSLGLAEPLAAKRRRVGSGNGAWGLAMLVSIPCHIEPDVRFSLIRLSDNLLLAAFKDCSSWPSSIACAGILVIELRVWLALRHAPSLTSSLSLVEGETLPSA